MKRIIGLALFFLCLASNVFAVDEGKMDRFGMNEESFSYYDFDGNLFFEPGEFDIMVGANSRDVQTKRIAL